MANCAALALFAWFVFLIRGGLACWFDGDDIMNLHQYWSDSWAALLKANVFFWSSYLRPAGGLFYKSLYGVWGLHPRPFRIVALVLLCANFWLLALVVRQLTGSRWAMLTALMVVGVNPAFSAAYFDTGSIYDILAYTFFWGAFALYVHIREAGAVPGAGRLGLLICLFVGALNSKEIAVSLPVAVALYELLWHPPGDARLASIWRWLRHEGRFAVIMAVCDVAYVIGKRYGPGSLWNVDSYRPHYTGLAYIQSLTHYLEILIYKPVTISSGLMAALLVVMTVVAAATRRRCLAWAVGFILAGVLPLAFIPGRGGFAYLVPSVGWAVYCAGLLDWLLGAIARHRTGLRYALQGGLLLLLFLKVAPWQRKWIEMHRKAAIDVEGRLRDRFTGYQRQIRTWIPEPRRGARILLLSDADGRDDFGICMLIRLTYGDSSLEVIRKTVWDANHVPVIISSYDYVLDWVDGAFILKSHK